MTDEFKRGLATGLAIGGVSSGGGQGGGSSIQNPAIAINSVVNTVLMYDTPVAINGFEVILIDTKGELPSIILDFDEIITQKGFNEETVVDIVLNVEKL